MKRNLAIDAQATLVFMQDRGLDPKKTALISAAVLCAVTPCSDIAHNAIDYIEECVDISQWETEE